MSATPRTQSIFNDLVKQNYGHASIEVAIKEVEQLETELAEAQNENNVLKAVLWYYCTQRGPNVIEELSEKVKHLESIILTIQACDIDNSELRGHHCLAKQWLCSLHDRIKRYKKGKRLK